MYIRIKNFSRDKANERVVDRVTKSGINLIKIDHFEIAFDKRHRAKIIRKFIAKYSILFMAFWSD